MKKRKQEFEDSRYKRWKEAERRYFEKKERQAKEAYEKRKITQKRVGVSGALFAYTMCITGKRSEEGCVQQ